MAVAVCVGAVPLIESVLSRGGVGEACTFCAGRGDVMLGVGVGVAMLLVAEAKVCEGFASLLGAAGCAA